MAKTLERDLGIYAVLTISLGAMIGSGIFVLPGMAYQLGGPAVMIAYLLAGLIVFPAALSKAEMATAMPESGGTYLYIDRAMGPLMGTIAGVGAWFSLVFKSAFALVGLGAYLLLFSDLPPLLLALLVGILLTATNVIGVKQTARLQIAVVSSVVAMLTIYLLSGMTWVRAESFHPLFSAGAGGLLAATGFVFVSYAGVTKIASVAEEIENPGQNIPLGMIMSISMMMIIYTLIVFVIVGVTPGETLSNTLTPVADAAEAFWGQVGVILVAVVAVLALISMANAGLLASSRYPFAMSRDRLVPALFKRVHQRYKTPVSSIVATGSAMLVLVVAVPVMEMAKLASAFQILVFSLENLAVISFRESQTDWYRPGFTSPGYPWVQLLGTLGGLILLSQMGWIPMIGAVAIMVLGTAAYFVYGKKKTAREGTSLSLIRRTADSRAIELTRRAVRDDVPYRVLVPADDRMTGQEERNLLHLVALLLPEENGQIQLMRFEEVPEQMLLHAAAARQTPEEIEFETHAGQIAKELGTTVEVGEVVSHDRKRAVRSYVRHAEIDLVVTGIGGRAGFRFFTGDIGWFMDNVACDTIFLRNEISPDIRRIAVLGAGGPYDTLKVATANQIATRQDASIQFIHVFPQSTSNAQVDSVTDYHRQLEELCHVPAGSRVERSDDLFGTLQELVEGSDLVIVGASSQRFFRRHVFTEIADRIAGELDQATLVVHSSGSIRRNFVGYLLERMIYSRKTT